ncbi:MFS transporter [Noviherbaspirillum cavernae]|uniref:MFS transporter n=1 Tax=Noviherbaspirillum cavernae TaxID=2320862 RepID=UPI001F5BC2A2|nr:MFS transporter [Noviherbaspirillum cavernae]
MIGLMWSLGIVAEIVSFFHQAPVFRFFDVQKLMVASLIPAVMRFLMIGYCAESLVLLMIAHALNAATFGGLILDGLWDTSGSQAVYLMAAVFSLAATS